MPHDQAVIPVETEDGHRFDLIDCADRALPNTVLFLPGLGITARHCIGFGQALASSGVRLLIHEWRGSGSSSLRAARSTHWGYRELLEHDLSSALATARQLAEGRVYIGGHSLGSQLAGMTAALHPNQIAGLIIIAGGVPYWRDYSGSMRLKILLAAGLFSSVAVLTGHFPGKRIGFAGRESRGVITDWSKTIVSGRYRLPGLTMGDEPIQLETAMAGLQTPILTLRMLEDHWVTQTCLEHLLRKMPSSRAEQHRIASEQQGRKANHFGWMKAPEASAGIVAEWIERNAAGKRSSDPIA